MWRTILGIVGGLVAWAVIATALDIGLRHLLAGYTRAEPILAFTLTMKIARLLLAVIASLGAGAVVRAIAPAAPMAPWIAGGVIVAIFLPSHIHIGLRLPLWYHFFFLTTLAPFVALGGWLTRRARSPGGRDVDALVSGVSARQS